MKHAYFHQVHDEGHVQITMITVDDMGIIIRARHFESGMMCMLLPCLSSYSYFNNSPGSSNHKKLFFQIMPIPANFAQRFWWFPITKGQLISE